MTVQSSDSRLLMFAAGAALGRYWLYRGTGHDSFRVGDRARYLRSVVFGWLKEQSHSCDAP